jgi:pyruvate dehydrogenase E2 component (dihydrolipoamide acetyltransferase)
MATDVLMPQMGESIAEGTIVKWLKKVGDSVERDEPLLEISTDKVDAEIPSPGAGVLLEIVAKEGETVAVNAVIARLGEAGEAGAGAPAAKAAAPAAPSNGVGAGAAPREEPAAAPAAEAAPPEEVKPPAPPSPPARPAPQAAPAEPALAAVGEVDGKKVRSSPLVRNIAREHGISLEEIKGTGLGGRVTKEDILDFIERRKGAPAPVAPAPPTPAPPAAPLVAPPLPHRFRLTPTASVSPLNR